MEQFIISFLLIICGILIYMIAYNFGYTDACKDCEDELEFWKCKVTALGINKESQQKEKMDDVDQLIELLDYQQGAHKRAKGK